MSLSSWLWGDVLTNKEVRRLSTTLTFLGAILEEVLVAATLMAFHDAAIASLRILLASEAFPKCVSALPFALLVEEGESVCLSPHKIIATAFSSMSREMSFAVTLLTHKPTNMSAKLADRASSKPAPHPLVFPVPEENVLSGFSIVHIDYVEFIDLLSAVI